MKDDHEFLQKTIMSLVLWLPEQFQSSGFKFIVLPSELQGSV